MESQQSFAEVEGTRLYYEVAGEGTPLVLVHGFTLDSRMWDAQLEVFARHRRVVRYDLRGFGQSPPPIDQPYADEDDLKALLDHLGIARTAVLGMSMGGGIALRFALAYPDATAALVLAGSTLPGRTWSRDFVASLRAVAERARAAGGEAARGLWLDHPLFAPARARPDVGPCLEGIISSYSGWHWVNEDPARAPDVRAAQRLEEITAPTLVLVGERDLPDFHGIAGELEQRIPHARKLVLPGVGHMANMEDPRRFNDAVLDFLSRA